MPTVQPSSPRRLPRRPRALLSISPRNLGDGTFDDVTKQSGTAGSGWSTSAAWIDLDNDGLLDLVVLRYLDWHFDDLWCGERRRATVLTAIRLCSKTMPSLVYRNEGNGRFTEVSAKIGIDKPGKGLGVAVADYDGDGRPDIFVANDFRTEFLYRNQGNSLFEGHGLMVEIAADGDGRTYADMGVDFEHYDNDGQKDPIVTQGHDIDNIRIE